MKLHDVCDEVDTSTVDDNVAKEAIPTRWVRRKTGPGVRSRIVARNYTEKIEDKDSVYASTPMFAMLRTLLALQMSWPNWIARLCDVSTAFLRAPIAKDHDGKQRYLWPPRELCPLQNIKRAEVLQKPSFQNPTSTPMRLALHHGLLLSTPSLRPSRSRYDSSTLATSSLVNHNNS